MQKYKLFFILILWSLCSVAAFAQYNIKMSAVSNGAGKSGSSAFTINTTIGQPVCGKMVNGLHLHSGFIYGIQTLTSIKDDQFLTESLPKQFELKQNYPNPFNPNTVISYQLPAISNVEISIYNSIGQKIATLVSEDQPAGYYTVEWEAAGYASGVYIYTIHTNKGFSAAKKLILLK